MTFTAPENVQSGQVVQVSMPPAPPKPPRAAPLPQAAVKFRIPKGAQFGSVIYSHTAWGQTVCVHTNVVFNNAPNNLYYCSDSSPHLHSTTPFSTPLYVCARFFVWEIYDRRLRLKSTTVIEAVVRQ